MTPQPPELEQFRIEIKDNNLVHLVFDAPGLTMNVFSDAAIVECRFGGTHRGPWAGIAATGNRMEVQAVCIFVFEGERLVCEKVYFDHAPVLRQMGA